LQCHAAKSPEKEKARFSLAQGFEVQLLFLRVCKTNP
jgi:hypothetical protein